MKVKFLVTPVGLMMGNIESARRLKAALQRSGVEVTDDPEDDRFDVLHVHTPVPPSNVRVIKKARSRGIPVVIHAHTTAEDSQGTWTGSTALSGLIGRYLTYFYNKGDLVLAPSAWTMERLRARGVTVPVRVLSNGVDLDRFRADQAHRARFRSKYGISEHATVVCSIGVVCSKKGIEVFPEVARSLPDLEFVWVGRRSKLFRPLVVGRAIGRSPANARYLEDVEDILDAHSGCDIFFTPSHVENQGMAVMEAMAVGRPIVARDLPSYKGMLEGDRSALLCDSDAGFAPAIKRLAEDASLADSMVRNARESVQNHRIESVASELKVIYASLLSGASGRGVVDR